MSAPLLTIHNHHGSGCGDPPIVTDTDSDLYIGYFENRSGEQWIFTLDRKTRLAELRGGDVGWNSAYKVENGKVTGLTLNEDEAAWLRACWRAAAGGT